MKKSGKEIIRKRSKNTSIHFFKQSIEEFRQLDLPQSIRLTPTRAPLLES